MGGKSKRNSSKLGSDGKPCDSAIGKEKMTAGASGGGWRNAGVGGWNARHGPKPDRKIRQQSMEWIRGSDGRSN